ncbi:hypothetical protein B5S31_g896 [[Candida] boidinii]|nr:hypothetical protein B5S31_g896 [[Candida] boidinii]
MFGLKTASNQLFKSQRLSSPFQLFNKNLRFSTKRSFASSRYAHNAFSLSYKSTSSSSFTSSGKYGLLLGLFGFGSTYSLINKPLIKNDSAYASSPEIIQHKVSESINEVTKPKSKFDGAFGGRLNYQELSIGSMAGLILGIIAGKLSSVIVFTSVSIYLTIQFLNAKGIITIPFTRIIKVGAQSIDLRAMIFEQPSFNITFLLTFVLAAYSI